eukprot:Em0020g397a
METLVDDFVTFYIGGQETTANTLSLAIILIHQHPEVLDSFDLLYNGLSNYDFVMATQLVSSLYIKYLFIILEIIVNSILGDRKEVTGDDLDKLKYTEQVVQEVLRMYPPVNNVTKEAPRGGIMLSGYYIPQGTAVFFVTSVMCRNPEYFNDPASFDPSRFDADKTRPGPFVYFPFGLSHRSCIGRHFAMIEAKVILARLLQTFKVTLPPSYNLVVEQKTTQQPKGDVLCTLQEIAV